MIVELFTKLHDQLFFIIWATVTFGIVVAGGVVGSLAKRWWLNLPYCARCWHGRVLPGDQYCLACKLEIY